MRNIYTNTTGNGMPANVAPVTPVSNNSTGSGMRKAVSIVVAAFFVWAVLISAGVQTGFAQSAGFNSSYAVFSINGGADAYYCMPSNTSCGANPSLSGANLGNFSGANSLVLKGAEHNVYKCGGADITSTTLNYRIYKTGTTPGSFTQSNIGFSSGGANGCGGQDQQWKDITLGINVLSGLTPANYTIEIFSEEATSLGTQFLNNSGSNYKATFNYCGSLSGALPAGDYAIPGCFTTIANAASYINANGVSGAVRFVIASGYSETAAPTGIVIGSATLNPTLSATNTVTFIKAAGTVTINAGVGTATPTSAAPDGIISIRGADYITLDGLTFTDGNVTNPATMEFGVALFKAGAGDGCNNNTIQNCTFNMQRINNASSTSPMIEGSVGILVINSTATAATTSLTPTNGGTLSTNGTNSGNRFYANTINGGNYGIGLSGFLASSGVGPTPTATTFLGDLGNDVGGSSSATGNSILNFGGGAATNSSAGIRANNQWSVNISFNTVNNNNGAGVNHATTLRGIYAQAGTSANATINNNIITIQSAATTNTISAIENAIGSTALSNTVSISNNVIQCGYTTATSGVFNGILNSSTATTININGNKISGTAANSLAGTGTHVMIETGSPVTVNVNNNKVYNLSRSGTSGSWRGIKMTSPTNFIANADTVDGLSWTTAASTGSIDAIYSFSSAVNVTVTNAVIRNLSTPSTGTITGITEFGVTGLKTYQNNQIYNFSTTAGGAGGATFRGISESTGSTNEYSGNQIYALNSTGTTGGAGGLVVGITFSSGTTNNVFKNKIYDLSTTSTNPTVTGINIGGGTTNNVYNNNVGDLRATAANAANAVIGINASSGTTNNVYYNTVYLNASSGGALFSSSGVFFSTSGTLNLRNNIIVNLSSFNGATNTAALRRTSGTAGTIPANYATTSNNNLFYAGTPGASRLIYVEGTVTTFTNPFSAMTGAGSYKVFMSTRDQASVTEVVSSTPGVFFQSLTGSSAVFLHMVAGLTTQVESGAASLSPTVTDDYDGHIRFGSTGYPGGTAGFPSGGTAPDMGADEFAGIAADLTGPAIAYTTLGNTSCGTDRTLSSTITDASGVKIAAGSKPRLYFKKSTDANAFAGNTSANNGWKYVEASNSASPFSFTTNYALLQTAVTAGDVIQYFVVASDSAASPNVGINAGTFVGATPTNVDLQAQGVTSIGGTPSSYTIVAAGLSGTVTIGAAGTYTSLSGAASSLFLAINTNGMSGNVTANIIDASVTETNAVTLNPINYNGCSAGPYTLTIKPTVTATLTGSSASALITINGADNVVIDGSTSVTSNTVCPNVAASRDLTITNTNTGTSSAVVWLQTNAGDGATNNTIMNCNLVGNSNTTTLFGVGSGSSTISTSSTGTGNNNNSYINNNISKTQYGIFSQGASAANKNTGTIINQNLINTASPNNVQIGGILIGFENNITIAANNIAGMSSPGSFSSADAFGISGTNGFLLTSTSGNEVTNATIVKNIISNVSQTNTGSAAGIYLPAATSGTNLIANNMISNIFSNGTSSDSHIGILIGGGAGSITNIFYNTVLLNNTTITGNTERSYALGVNGSTPVVNIRNNILMNVGSTGANLNRVIGLGYTSTVGNYVNLVSDHNNFFVSGTGSVIAQTGGLGSGGTTRTALSDWTAQTGRDGAGSAPNPSATTLQINPVFVGAPNLHLVSTNATNLPLNDAAITVSVTDDIDCDIRATDIGSDEFTPPACGAVVAGNVSATNAGPFCGSGSSTLSITGVNTGITITYQWQSSQDAAFTSPVNLGSAATQAVSLTTPADTIWYRCIINCSADLSKDTTDNVFNLKIYAVPTASITEATPLSVCAPNAQLYHATTDAATPTYQWTLNGIDISGATNATYAATAAGSYAVKVTSFTCTTTSSAKVLTVNPEVVASAFGIPSIICLGEPTILSTTATAGLPGMPPYNVSASTGTISAAVPDGSLTGVSTNLTLSGAGAATIDASSTVKVTVSITSAWDTDLDLYLVGPSSCGTLELSTDNGGGSGSVGYVGTVLATDATTNINTITSLTIGAGPFRTEGLYNTAPVLASGISSGSYSLPATAISGCPVDGQWTLFVADDAGSDVSTLTSFDLNIYNSITGSFTHTYSGGSGSIPATTYSGANNITGEVTVTPTVAGNNTYTVVTQAPSGCTDTNTIVINVKATPTGALTGDTTICAGGTATLHIAVTGTGPWSGTLDDGTAFSGSSSPIAVAVSPVSNHTYSIATLSDNDCIAQPIDMNGSAAVTVNSVVPVSVLLAVDANPVCAGIGVVLTATPTNGGAAPNYEFFKNTISVQSGSANTYAYTPANGDAIYVKLTNTDAGCYSTNPATSSTVNMTVNPLLPVSVTATTPSDSICAGSPVTFTANPTNGGSSPAYQWYLNGAPVSGETNSTYNTSSLADQDSVWVELTSNATCATGSPATSNHLVITVSGAITASITISTVSPTTICSGTSVTFTSITTGGSGTYQWMNGGSPISGATNSSYTTDTLANGDAITCEFSANFACATPNPATSNTITMTVNPSPAVPVISANGPLTFCGPGSVKLWSQYSGAGILWSTTETSDTIIVSSTSSITVTYTVAGCSSTSAPAVVTVNSASALITPSTATVCTGGTVTLTASATPAAASYLWSPGGETTNTITVGAGTYSVITTDGNGCKDTATAIINENASPSVTVDATCTTIFPGGSVTLTANATAGSGTITGYQWKNSLGNIVGATNSTYTTSAAESYTVVVTNSNGCSTTSSPPVVLTTLSGALAAGSYAIPSNCGFQTINAAVTYLNANGVAGSVVFNVAGGHSESAPVGGIVYNQCALSSGVQSGATRTVTFQKSGGGANPKINAYTGTSLTVDGIVKIVGGDYITFDGIDVAEIVANTTPTLQMEWGYALLKCDGNNGSNSNNIKNCAITLNKANTASVGIYSGNHTAANNTGLTYSNGAGNEDASRNGRNTFYGNTISNTYTGISLNGNATAGPSASLNDTLNQVGMIGQAANSITTFGGGSVAVNAITESNQRGISVDNNSINGGTSSTSTVTGISMGSGVWGNIRNNTITLASSATSSTMTGITCGFIGGTASNPNLVNITGNTVQNVNYATSTSAAFTAITCSAGGTSAVININSNTVQNNTVAGTGTITCITSSSGPSGGTVNINSNTVSGNTASNVSTTTHTLALITNSGSPATLSMSSNTINNNSHAGVGTMNGLVSTGSPTNFTMSSNTITNNNMVGGAATCTVTSSQSGTAIYTYSNNTIRNNGVSNMTGSSTATVVGYTNSSSPSSETISNNSIRRLYVNGASTGTHTIRGILNNTLSTSTRTVSGNQIDSLYSAGSATITGITSSAGGTVLYSKNRVFNLIGAGINSTVTGMSVTAGTSVGVYNNYIGDLLAPAATGTNAVIGIANSGSSALGLYFNTIRIAGGGGTTFGSSGVSVTTTNAFEMRNNIIDNLCTPGSAGTSFVVAYRRSSTGFTGYTTASNQNNFYAGGPSANRLIYFSSTADSAQSLSKYKSSVGARDQQSVTEDPPFISTSPTAAASDYLHISSSIATQMESGAANITGITDDWDGHIRFGNVGYPGGNPGYPSGGTAPDIGADEFNGILSDHTSPVITYTALSNGCTADRTLTATITDASGVRTSGLYVPRIYYKKGAGSYFSQPGTLTSGTATNGTWTFTIVSSDFGGAVLTDVISYYIIAQDTVPTPNISSNPTGAIATDVNNVSTHPSPNTFTIVSSNVTATATATPPSICNGATSSLSATATKPGSSAPGSYTFAGSTGSGFSFITGTTVTLGSQDDGFTGNLPIGFTFNYNGIAQTVFAVSPNGWMKPGETTSATSGFFSNALISNANFIAPLWDDNNMTGGDIQYLTTGGTGNHVLTVQWKNMHVAGSGSATNPTISMQAILYEATGVIQFVYGATSAALSSPTASIGISGNTGNFLSVTPLSPASASTASNAVEFSVTSSANLPSGTVYTFTPPVTAINNFTWQPAVDLVSNTGSPVTTNSLSTTTTFTVTATDASTGCTATATATVTVGEPLSLAVNSDTICIGQTTTLTAVPTGGGAPFSYEWSPALGLSATSGATVNANPTVSSVYEVIVTDNCGAKDTAYTTVTVNPIPTVNVSPLSASACGGVAAILTASGSSVSYTWAPAAGLNVTTGASVSANPTAATTYTVTGTSSNSCTNTASVLVQTGGAITVTATATPTAVCSGDTANLTSSASQAGLNYAMSALSGQTYSTLTGGGITVINTAAQLLSGFSSGTQDDGGVLVTLPFTFTYAGNTFTQMAMSTNGWIAAGSANAAISSSFDHAAANLFSTNLPSNTIAAWFKDMGANFPTGGGSMRHGLIGTDVYAFQWDKAVGSGFSDGATILISFQINIYGPASSAPGRVELIYGPTVGTITFAASIGIEDGTGGTNHFINALTGNGTATTTSTAWPGNGNGYSFTPSALTYAWTPVIDVVSASSQNTSTHPLITTTTFSVIATGTGGCSDTANVTVVANPLTAFTVNSDTICEGYSTTLTAITTGGGAPFNYTWSPAAGLSATTGASVTANPDTTTIYQVIVNDGCGASDTAYSTVTVIPTPTVVIAPSPLAAGICNGSGSVTMVASGTATSFTWAPASGLDVTTGATVVATPASTTTYTVTGYSANGCTITATQTVTVVPTITLVGTATPSTVCSNATTQLTANASIPSAAGFALANLTGRTYTTLSGGGITIINTAAQLTAGMGTGAQDDGGVVINLPFTFTYNGLPFTQMSMCTNGWVGAGNWGTIGGADMRAGANLFTGTVPNNTLAAWFKDMGANFPLGTGSMRHGLIGTDIYAFQWDKAVGSGFSDGSSTLISFQINIYGPLSSAPGRIEMVYGPTVGTIATAASIGLEDATGGPGHFVNALNGSTTSTTTSTAWPGDGNGFQFTPISPVDFTYVWTPDTYLDHDSIQNPIASNVAISTVYTVTVTSTGGCTQTDTASVISVPVPSDPTATNSMQCGLGVPAAYVTSTSSLPTPGYHWYLNPSGGIALSGETMDHLTAYTINATDTFYVTEFNGQCESNRVMVIAEVTQPDLVTASVAPDSICFGAGTVLSVVQTGSTNTYEYTWTAIPATGSGISGSAAGQTVNIIPTAAGTYQYIVLATDTAAGCTTIDTSGTLTVNENPGINNVAATPPNICNGGSTTLSAQSGTGGPGFATVGTASASPIQGGSPFRAGGSNEMRTQILYTQADLSAAGFAAGYLTSISFNFTSASGGTLPNYTMSIGNTGVSALTSTFETSSMQVVLDPVALNPPTVTGPFAITFDHPFYWDGLSNIIVQVCHGLPTGSAGSGFVAATSMGVGSDIQSLTAGACSAATGTLITSRPDATFGGQIGVNTTALFKWVWTPGPLNGATVNASPAITTTYTVTATDTITTCSSTDTVTVHVGEPLVVTVSSDTICAGQAGTLTTAITGGGYPYTYLWSPGNETTSSITVSPGTTTNYSVMVIDFCGDTAYASGTVTVDTLPVLVVSPSSPTICTGGSVAMSVTGANTYTWSPSLGLTPTTGASVTANPATNTTYTVTGTNGNGCVNTTTVAVAVLSPPTITAVTANLPSICAGGSSTLTATAFQSGALLNNYALSSLSGQTYSTLTGGGITVINSVAQLLPGFSTGSQDDGGVLVTLPFTFTYAGNTFTQMAFSTNGWVAAGSANAAISSSFDHAAANLFSTTLPSNAIAAWFKDMGANFPTGSGSMRHGLIGTDIYAFQWDNAVGSGFSDGSSNLISFQINIYGPASSAPGRIELIYGPTAGTTAFSAAIGMKDGTGGTDHFINALTGNGTATTTSTAWPGDGNGFRFNPIPPTSLTYAWSPAATLADSTANPATANGINATTMYTVTVTNIGGCSSVDSVQVEVIEANAYFDAQPEICKSDAGGAILVPDVPGGVFTSDATGAIVEFFGTYYFDATAAGATPGPHVITYTTYLGCASFNDTIMVVADPTPTLGTIPDVCQNAAAFELTYGSPSGGLYYIDNNPSALTGNIFNPASYSSGSHIVTYTFTNSTGCSGSVNGSITVNLPSAPTAYNDTVCDSYTLPWGGTVTTSGSYSHTYTNAAGCDSVVTAHIVINSCSVNFDVTLYIQGYMDEFNIGYMKPVMVNQGLSGASDPNEVDTIMIVLHDAGSYAPVDTFKGILHTNGLISCTFDNASGSASYFISIHYKNALETWSAAAVPMSALSYDFSSDVTQAYPDVNNPNPQMIYVDGHWTVYSGDVNQDGQIAGDDFNIVEFDVTGQAFGYNVTDITGNGPTAGEDFNLLELNVSYGLFVAHP